MMSVGELAGQPMFKSLNCVLNMKLWSWRMQCKDKYVITTVKSLKGCSCGQFFNIGDGPQARQ